MEADGLVRVRLPTTIRQGDDDHDLSVCLTSAFVPNLHPRQQEPPPPPPLPPPTNSLPFRWYLAEYISLTVPVKRLPLVVNTPDGLWEVGVVPVDYLPPQSWSLYHLLKYMVDAVPPQLIKAHYYDEDPSLIIPSMTVDFSRDVSLTQQSSSNPHGGNCTLQATEHLQEPYEHIVAHGSLLLYMSSSLKDFIKKSNQLLYGPLRLIPKVILTPVGTPFEHPPAPEFQSYTLLMEGLCPSCQPYLAHFSQKKKEVTPWEVVQASWFAINDQDDLQWVTFWIEDQSGERAYSAAENEFTFVLKWQTSKKENATRWSRRKIST